MKLAETGENLGRATQHFVVLLEQFGSMALEQAMREALAAGKASCNAVRSILDRQRQTAGQPPTTPVDLPDDERVSGIVIPPRDLRSYDDLLDGSEEVGDDAAS